MERDRDELGDQAEELDLARPVGLPRELLPEHEDAAEDALVLVDLTEGRDHRGVGEERPLLAEGGRVVRHVHGTPDDRERARELAPEVEAAHRAPARGHEDALLVRRPQERDVRGPRAAPEERGDVALDPVEVEALGVDPPRHLEERGEVEPLRLARPLEARDRLARAPARRLGARRRSAP